MNQEKQPFAGAIIVMFLFAALFVGGGIYGYLYYTGQVTLPAGIPGISLLDSTSTPQADTAQPNDPSREQGDINDDGAVDFLDAQYISTHDGCTSADPCWSDVVDKTVTGHNPIYTSDLDLNQDGSISEADAAIISGYTP